MTNKPTGNVMFWKRFDTSADTDFARIAIGTLNYREAFQISKPFSFSKEYERQKKI